MARWHLFIGRVVPTVLAMLFAACEVRRAEAAISWGPPYEGGTNYKVIFDRLEVVNPQYTFDQDPTYGSVTVGFGTHFNGQVLGKSYNSLSSSAPSGTLGFAEGLPDVMTQFDLRKPGTIRLGGVKGMAR